MRTFSRQDWQDAEQAWSDGGFGWRWGKIRRLARESGMLYPPSGTAHDDRDSPEPTQRAIVWRALEDNPAELERIVRTSRSWSGVVDRIIGMDARLRADADYNERDVAFDRDDPDHREAVMALGDIFSRIEASR
jgi:hypothetical protein